MIQKKEKKKNQDWMSLPSIYFFPDKLFITLRHCWCPHLLFLFISCFCQDKMLKCEIFLATECGLTLYATLNDHICALLFIVEAFTVPSSCQQCSARFIGKN